MRSCRRLGRRYGSTFTILGTYSGDLNDGGERVVLNDRNGAVISEFTYGDGSGPGDDWPPQADDGYSLLYVAGDSALPASWRASTDPGGSAVTTFARWQSRYFADADIPSQGLGADTDGDGLNNLGEYAFATDPRRAGTEEQNIALAAHGQPGRFTFRRRTGTSDLVWTVETSSALTAPWTAVTGPPAAAADNGDGTESLTYDAPGAPAAQRLFIRARASVP